MNKATSKVEANAIKAAEELAASRIAEIQQATGNIQKAGYILGQVYERTSKNLYHLDDVHALAAVANAALAAQVRILNTLKSHEVSAAAPGDVPPSDSTAPGGGLIISG